MALPSILRKRKDRTLSSRAVEDIDDLGFEAIISDGDSIIDEEDPFTAFDDDQSDVGSTLSKDGKSVSGDELRPTLNGDTESIDSQGEADDFPQTNYTIVTDANGNERYEYQEIEPVYDSDDSDARQPINTIGNIPLSFYDSYPHIGYNVDGKKIMRPATGQALDALLDSIELPTGWTGLTDPETGKPLNLNRDELELLRRVQMNQLPEANYDPYPDSIPYFTSIEEQMPLTAAPEPKRRFVPSKFEAKRIAKLVQAIKQGRILPYKSPKERQSEAENKQDIAYDVWENEEPQDRHIMNLAMPKMPPPGYDLSYNPPPEYVPSHEERVAWQSTDPEDREKGYLPASYESLRKVPGYGEFVKERFERCLDLYLAPRIRKNKLNVNPESLLPKMPRPEELRPFPTVCQTIFHGHTNRVRSVAFSPDGDWIASGGDDGTVRLWTLNGHQEWMVKLSPDESVDAVCFRPIKETFILAAAVGEDMFFMIPYVISDVVEKHSREVLDAGFGYATNGAQSSSTGDTKVKDSTAKWARPGSKLENAGVQLRVTTKSPIKSIKWHRRGDFICTVAPTGQRSAVVIHTVSKHLSQVPFRRLPGLAQTAQFHPVRPLFFVATQRMIRCYDLQRQELVKIVQPGARWISSMDVHPGGDNLIVGSYDRRLLWHDLDLSTRPHKTMRFHEQAIRAVRYHKTLPLFADASDDGSLQIFHGRVTSDLTENAMIVPVKMLKGHKISQKLGVLDVDWHPRHPWCVSAGADGTCRLWA